MIKIGRLKICVFTLLCNIFLTGTLFAEVVVTAKLSDSVIGVNEPFTLTVTVDGGSGNVNLPNVDGLSLRGTSQARNMTFSGGKLKSSQIFYYTFVAAKEGNYTIPKIDVRINGTRYSAGSVSIKVTSESTRQPNITPEPFEDMFSIRTNRLALDDVHVENTISQKKVYLNQPIYLEQVAYTRIPVRVLGITSIPERTDFFSVTEQTEYQSRRQTINGETFSVKPLRREVLYPVKTGKKVVPTSSFVFQTSGSIFSEQIERGANEYEIEVLPLPTQGKPSYFSGAVGEFDFNVLVSETNITVGDAIVIDMIIKGEGNIATITTPMPYQEEISNYFTLYTPESVETNWFEGNSYLGIKNISHVLVARTPGEFSINSVSLSYFDPKSSEYKVKVADGFVIKVSGKTNIAINGINSAEDIDTNSDQGLEPKLQVSDGKQKPVFLLMLTFIFLIATFVFALCFIMIKKLKKQKNTKHLKEINTTVKLDISTVEKYFEMEDRNMYCKAVVYLLSSEICNILNLEKRVDINETSKTIQDINQLVTAMQEAIIPSNLIEDIKNIVNACNMELYAGTNKGSKLDYHSDIPNILSQVKNSIASKHN